MNLFLETDEAMKLWWNIIEDGIRIAADQHELYLAEKHNKLFQTSRRKISVVQKTSSENLQKLLESVNKKMSLIWTFEYPVPRVVFRLILQTCTQLMKEFPKILKVEPYLTSLCCLLPDFEIHDDTVKFKKPAPRFVPKRISPERDLLDDLCILMNNGIELRLVLAICESSNLPELKKHFISEDKIHNYIAENIPDFCVHNDRVYPSIRFSPRSVALCSPTIITPEYNRISVQEDIFPEKPCVELSIDHPIKTLQFYILRFRLYAEMKQIQDRKKDFKGMPISWFTKQMGFLFGDDEVRSEKFVKSYEAFCIRDGRVNPTSHETIIFLEPLAFMVIVEDIAKYVRRMLELPLKIFRANSKNLDWKKVLQLEPTKTVELFVGNYSGCKGLPLDCLKEILKSHPRCGFIEGLFPGKSLLRDFPMLSKLTAYPLHFEKDQLILV